MKTNTIALNYSELRLYKNASFCHFCVLIIRKIVTVRLIPESCAGFKTGLVIFYICLFFIAPFAGQTQTQSYTAAGSFTFIIPADVPAKVECWGGGGAGEGAKKTQENNIFQNGKGADPVIVSWPVFTHGLTI